METSNFSRVRGVRGPDSPHENCHFQPENREFRPNLAKSCQILRNPGSRPSNSWKSGSNRPKSAQISLLDLKNRKIEKKNTLVRAWNRTFTLFQGRPPKLTKNGVKSGSKRGQIGVQTVKSGSKCSNPGPSGQIRAIPGSRPQKTRNSALSDPKIEVLSTSRRENPGGDPGPPSHQGSEDPLGLSFPANSGLN